MTERREFWRILADAQQWADWVRACTMATDVLVNRRAVVTMVGCPGVYRLVIDGERRIAA